MILRYLILLVVSIEADLISWNRTSNTVARNNFRRGTASNLLDQYQHFFNRKNKNADFIRSRRLFQSVRKF